MTCPGCRICWAGRSVDSATALGLGCVVAPLVGAVLAVGLALFWLLYGAVSELHQMYQRWLDGR